MVSSVTTVMIIVIMGVLARDSRLMVLVPLLPLVVPPVLLRCLLFALGPARLGRLARLGPLGRGLAEALAVMASGSAMAALPAMVPMASAVVLVGSLVGIVIRNAVALLLPMVVELILALLTAVISPALVGMFSEASASPENRRLNEALVAIPLLVGTLAMVIV